jgi:hypothetical protein
MNLLRYFTLLWSLFLVFGVTQIAAQNLGAPCGTDELRRLMLAENPDLGKVQKLAEDKYLDQILNGTSSNKQGNILTIPVVVHILHLPGTPLGTGENLTDVQVKAGLDALNSILMGTPCAGNAPGNPVGIQLCLATQTIQGQATSGINRFATNLANIPYGLTHVVCGLAAADGSFPPSNYLNIYLAKTIWSFNDGNGIVDSLQGFATGSAVHGTLNDGVFVRSQFWFNPSNNCEGAKVSAHQIGHYLDLFHTFEAGCPNDNCHLQGDRVCDTPPDNLQKSGSSCGTHNSCATDPDDDIYYNPFIDDQPDAENNFMDYSDQVCQTQFTIGQIERMNVALQVSRRSLLASQGCTAPCSPYVNAQIQAPNFIMVNTPVQFIASQVIGSNLSWTVNGQSAGTGFVLNYTFANTGKYNVALTVSNANGCSRTSSSTVQVYKNCNLNAQIINSKPLCYGSYVDLMAYPGGGQWLVDGQENSGFIDSYQYGSGSTHTLTYIATDDECLQTVTKQMTISSNIFSVTSIGAIDCTNPQPIQVQVNMNGNGFYSWVDPLGASGSGNGLFFTTKVGGDYKFTVHQGALSCEGTYYIQTKNNDVYVTAENCSVCTGSYFPKISLCASSSTPNLSYSWTNGGYPISGQKVDVSAKGQWLVKAVNNAGCLAADVIEIKSLANLNPWAAAGTDISWVCFQQMPRLNGAFPSGGGDLVAAWSTSNGNIIPDINPMNPQVTRPGMYILTVKNTTSNCIDRDTSYVVEHARKAVEVKTICAGESYQGHSVSGNYNRTVTYARSCDSIYTLKLTVLPPNTTETYQTICAGESYQGHSSSGAYVSTHIAQNGCDSTHTLQLIVLPTNTAESVQTICAGESFQGHSSSGTYVSTHIAQNGCDSTHTLQLIVLPAITAESAQTICAGETFQGHSSSGTYVSNLIAQNGCDSTHSLQLTVLLAITAESAQTICAGESFQGHSSSGTYVSNLIAQNGCDSTHTLQLIVLPSITAESAQTICAGESFQGHSSSGTYVSTHIAQNGCDSTHTLQLIVLPAISAESAQTICAGESFLGHNSSGTYVSTHIAQNGCDSTHTLLLTVLPANTTESAQTICPGESFQGHNSSGTYVSTHTAQNGCDSTNTLQLTVLAPNTTESALTICAGETFEGHSISGTYVSNYVDQNGCDSTHTLQLTVSAPIIINQVVVADVGIGNGAIDIVIISGDGPFLYLWSNGSTTPNIGGLPAGIYILTITDANNCTIQLTVEVPLAVPVTETGWEKDIRVFPNPLEQGEILHIQLPNPIPVSVCRIYDTQGRLIQSNSVSQQELSIRFQDSGVYWIQLLDEAGKFGLWRVVVF